MSRLTTCSLGLLAACSPDRTPESVAPTTANVPASTPAAIPAEPMRSTMVRIPAGSYRSFFPGKDEPERVAVASFHLEVHAVTNTQYLRFVEANPQWRRSTTKRLFTDQKYLMHWSGDLKFAPAMADRPVTNVSWFAARSYAAWIGRRLPTLQEWEYVAAASEHAADGAREVGHNQRILDWYSAKSPGLPAPVRSTPKNFFGAYDMHGLVWEWVENFNTALVTGESRGDTGLERTLFCGAGSIGSANPADYASFMRFAFRSSLQASYTGKNLGFRCASDVARSGKSACCSEAAVAPPLPGTSVYQLASTWQDQDAKDRTLSSFRGRPVIMAMMFTTCEYACPRLLADLKAIETGLGDLRDRVRFVLVSFDSVKDTPPVLAEYAASHALDRRHWTLLHGAQKDVRELAAVLGVKYKRSAAIGFSHSNLITLLGADGRVLHRQTGIGTNPTSLLEELRNSGK